MTAIDHTQNRKTTRRHYTLLLLTFLGALAFMDRQIIAVLIQPVKAEFGLSDLQIGLISGLGFAFTFALSGIPLGHLSDNGIRRNIIAWTRGLGGLVAACGAASTGLIMLMISRSGSAISEAGGTPASISLVSDLYPAEQRSRVISLLGTGNSMGALFALLIGSWLAQTFGWRITMAVVGLGAVFFSVLLRVTVQEPARHATHTPSTTHPFKTFLELWTTPITRWLVLGAMFALFAGYGFGTWNNALLIRQHGLTLQFAGSISAAAALASALGTVLAGILVDKLVRRDKRWQFRIPVIGLAIALPCGLAYLMVPAGAIWPCAILIVIFAFTIAWWAAPVFAALSFIVSPNKRATAHAGLMLVTAIVGSGLGPIAAGWLSDFLNQYWQGQGLRYAMVCIIATLLPALYAFWRAGQMYGDKTR